jgi:endonuclease/exonuclease/phosphatase (EEP) superfamily protein YafD
MGLACLVIIRGSLDSPFRVFPLQEEAQLNVVNFNHHFNQKDFSSIKKWLIDNHNSFDAVILQEANSETIATVSELKDYYPYQIHEPRHHPFGIILLSRHPYLEKNVYYDDGLINTAVSIKVVIQPEEFLNPISIYTTHPDPPADIYSFERRDKKLETISSYIRNDTNENIILIGDLNITPYAPMFKKLTRQTGLKFQSYGFFLNPSWPAQFFFPIFQIPIDHALFSANLKQHSKVTADSFGSDHKSLIVSFSERL